MAASAHSQTKPPWICRCSSGPDLWSRFKCCQESKPTTNPPQMTPSPSDIWIHLIGFSQHSLIQELSFSNGQSHLGSCRSSPKPILVEKNRRHMLVWKFGLRNWTKLLVFKRRIPTLATDPLSCLLRSKCSLEQPFVLQSKFSWSQSKLLLVGIPV